MDAIYKVNKPEDDPWNQIKDYQDAKYLEDLIKSAKEKPDFKEKKYELLRHIATSECFRQMRIMLIHQLES